MSLNYDLKNIKDADQLTEGEIACMAFAAMFIGQPIITEEGKTGWYKFATRIRAWETVTGKIRKDDEFLTPEQVHRFIGLRTNATTMTDAQFKKHIAETALRRAQEQIDRAKVA